MTDSPTAARLAARPIADGGTAVQQWTSWAQTFDALDLDACPALTVVAPHPDDETLGLGATIATVRAAGVPVRVVSVTDGEAAYPGLDDAGRNTLKELRRNEIRCAMAALGADEPLRLGLPDGGVSAHETDVADRLTAILAEGPAGAWCAATWRGDGHPDHEAVGRAAAVAAERAGAVLLEYPVWMWHWAEPDDPAVPWRRGRRAPLSDTAIRAKSKALRSFASQTQPMSGAEPVLPPHVLERISAVGELVFR